MDIDSLIQQVRQQLQNHYDSEQLLLLQYLQHANALKVDFDDSFFASLAKRLQMPAKEISGIARFYSFLDSAPGVNFDIRVSDNITDHMQGNAQVIKTLAEKYADNQAVSISTTSCIGMNDQGPAMLINGMTIAALNQEKLLQVCDLIDAGRPVNEWPADLFQVADNIQQKALLLSEQDKTPTALEQLTKSDPETLLTTIEQSGLRGRGGAGFNTATKWRFCRQAKSKQRYVICNADEGEPGTFKDRVLLNSYADEVIEGMTLCAGIIGATEGFIYLRGEYRYLLPKLQQVLQQRRENNLLGKNILGKPGFDFDIDIHLGAGAYICGEETALIESLEGKRGIPRKKPPFPVTNGYCDQPTVVNNVETFLAAARIAANGADWFTAVGTEQSSGTKILSISGDCTRPGIYEYPFGVSVQDILDDCGVQNTQAVQVAGAAGHLIPASAFDRKISFEDLGTGGSFMIFDHSRDLVDVIHNFTGFFKHESCGFCTPCRVGTSLQHDLVEKIRKGHATNYDLEELKNIGMLMTNTSHCGLGTTAATATLGLLQQFPELIDSRLTHSQYEPAFDLNTALQQARELTQRDDEHAHLGGSS